MYIKDTTNSCTIYDKPFLNDLYPYSLSLVGTKISNSLKINYKVDNTSVIKDVNFNFDILNSAISSAKNLFNPLDDCWFPVFIDQSYYSVVSKEILRGSSIRRKVLGIENFLTFAPLMENWTASEGILMSVNWFINSNLIADDPSYGLLLWAKKNSIKNNLQNTIDKFPNGTRLKSPIARSYMNGNVSISIDPNDFLVKINNNILKILNKDDSIFKSDSGKFVFSEEQHIFDIGAYAASIEADKSEIKFTLDCYDIDSGLSNYALWIPDGECYSSLTRDDIIKRVPSDTYLSAGLFHYYRSIYHRLTSKIVKVPGGLSIEASRRLKKLSYHLATSPLIDRVSIDYLLTDNIQNMVSSYIGSTVDSEATNEKNHLGYILTNILKEYRTLTYNLDNKTTLSGNIIRNKIDLFTKITTKYGAFLKYNQSGSLSYKKQLSNGPHCMINRLMKTYCHKDLNNTSVFYNENIFCGNIKIGTDIRDDRSEILITSNDVDKQIIPLADIHRTQASIDASICVGPDRIIKASQYMRNGEIEYGLTGTPDELKVNLDDDLFRSTLKWELIDGPSCLRFSDYRLDKYRQSRFKTSSEDGPIIYAKKIGAYTLRVTATTEFFSGSDTITLYIVNDEGEYAPGKKPTLLDTTPCDQRQDTIISGDNLKCMCPNLRSFAINKRGMFWPVQSDLYVKYMNTLITQDFDDLGVMRLDSFHRYSFKCSRIQDTDAYLSFYFSPNNTYIAFYGISLMNMRDGIKYPQCQSFYEDVLVEMNLRPAGGIEIETGATKYYRARRYPDGITLVRTIINPDGSKTEENIDINYPIVTTNYASPVFTYGGYESDVIKSLGINIPGHPSSGTILPALKHYNNMSDPAGIRCFLEDVPISNSGNLLCDKGFFHPQKGWIPSNNSLDEYIKKFSQGETANPYSNFSNKTSVIKFRPETHKSLLFKGAGFLNLRSSSDGSNNVQSSAITLAKSDGLETYHNTAYGYTNPNGYASFDTTYTDEYSYDDGGDTTTYNCDQDTNVTYFLKNIDGLTIKDLEVKINFLNYPNPKNLVLWLEVSNDNGLPYRAPKSLSDTYERQLQDLNKNPDARTKKLYLLNQESIDHYHHNISLLFTDSASTANTTFDTNKVLPTGIKHDQKLAGSETYKLRPTLMNNGYSDVTATYHINKIKYSKQYDQSFSFSKFRDIPLKNTVFTLKATIVNHTDKINSGDELTNNGVLSGFVREKTKLVSNVDINSLCNWELIIHTDKVKHPLPVESIGLIDRSVNTTTYDGYNFIVNLQNKEHLVPQVNINAPYNYISNINTCKYYDNELSQSMSWRTPTFPDWAILYIIVNTGFGGYIGGGVLGVLTGNPDPGYAALYRYFRDITLAKRANDTNDLTRIPSYARFPFGSPDKALVEISTDQRFWYKTEVPFFRYNNSKILDNKEYGYIKLSSLQNFYTFQYKKADSNSTDFNNNADPNKTNSFANGLAGFYLIKGKKLFYLLKIGDTVKMSGSTVEILRKELIYKDNSYYTIIQLVSNPSASEGQLLINFTPSPQPSPEAGAEPNKDIIAPAEEIILIYDKKYTMIDNNQKKYNQWGLQTNENNNIPVSRTFNSLGEGSYGRGTDALRENSFHDITENYNDLGNIVELYDDDKYFNLSMKQNNIFYREKESQDWSTINFIESDRIYGYAFSEEDAGDFVWWNNKDILGADYIEPKDRPMLRDFLKSLDQEKNSEPNIRSSIFFDKNSIKSMIQLRGDKFKNIPPTGSIKIQNIFEEKIHKEPLNPDDWTKIKNRIDFLKSNTGSDSIGTLSNPLSLSIPNLVKYIELLPKDPDGCYNGIFNVPSLCKKRAAKKILSAREDELRNLEYHFDESNVAEQGVVPKIKRSVSINNTDGGSISVTETVNDNYYWFNLSKEHKLSPAVNANPKILKKSVYKCFPIAGDVVMGFRHLTETGETAVSGGESTLEIPEEAILAKKREYSFVSEWREDTQERFMFFTEDDYLKEMLVTVVDTYLIPSDKNYSAITTAEELLSDSDNIYIRFRNIPRKFKEIDSYYDTYRPNRMGQPVKQLGFFTKGETYNNFVCWRCTTDKERQNYVETPLFYQYMNEMIFRSFYGSADGVEHKNIGIAKSKEPWEWIPYEYF